MIGFLKGRILYLEEGEFIIDSGGVGYRIISTPKTIASLVEGEKRSFFIHTDVKETDISLYGFQSKVEQKLFLMLKTVKGIGSKVSLGIMNELGPEKLLHCIATGNLELLVAVKGIGKKTAERVMVELRENVAKMFSPEESNAKSHVGNLGNSSIHHMQDDVVMALVKLGFPQKTARETIQKINKKHSGADLDNSKLLNIALQEISSPTLL